VRQSQQPGSIPVQRVNRVSVALGCWNLQLQPGQTLLAAPGRRPARLHRQRSADVCGTYFGAYASRMLALYRTAPGVVDLLAALIRPLQGK